MFDWWFDNTYVQEPIYLLASIVICALLAMLAALDKKHYFLKYLALVLGFVVVMYNAYTYQNLKGMPVNLNDTLISINEDNELVAFVNENNTYVYLLVKTNDREHATYIVKPYDRELEQALKEATLEAKGLDKKIKLNVKALGQEKSDASLLEVVDTGTDPLPKVIVQETNQIHNANTGEVEEIVPTQEIE